MDEPFKNSLILNKSLQSWLTQWGQTGSSQPPKPHSDTHIESLGALGSRKSFVTWVALKCKGRSPGCAQGDAPGQGEQPTGAVGDAPVGLGGSGGQSPQLSWFILF